MIRVFPAMAVSVLAFATAPVTATAAAHRSLSATSLAKQSSTRHRPHTERAVRRFQAAPRRGTDWGKTLGPSRAPLLGEGSLMANVAAVTVTPGAIGWRTLVSVALSLILSWVAWSALAAMVSPGASRTGLPRLASLHTAQRALRNDGGARQ
jgi:hypothetical protein